LMYMIPGSISHQNGILYFNNKKLKYSIYSVILAYVLLQYLFSFLCTRINLENHCAVASVKCFDRQIKLNVLMDTGNNAKHPITGAYVIVLYYKSIHEVFDFGVVENESQLCDALMDKLVETNKASAFFVVPYTTLGKTNGIMPGFITDGIDIEVNEESFFIANCPIAISYEPIKSFGECVGLINPQMLA